MFKKKAQITLFVIIGLVLLLGAVTYFFISKNTADTSMSNQIQLSDDGDVAAVQKFIFSCTENVVLNTLFNLSATSFFTPSSNPSLNDRYYFYFSGRSLYPERLVVERRYAEFIHPKILACLNNYSSISSTLSKQLVQKSPLALNVSLFDRSIVVNVNSGLELGDGSSSVSIGPISVTKSSRIGLTYAIGRLVLFPENSQGNFYDSALDLATKNNFYFSIYPSPDVAGDLIVTIQDFDADSLHPNVLSYLMHYGVYTK